jgi:serine/threonine-protein kinase
MAARLVVDRYELVAELSSGGMATVYLGRVRGAVGFSRTVAVKRLHPQFSRDPDFVAMFLDEARLASRIGHPNVVPTIDVASSEGELFLVMEYVHGEALSAILRAVRARHSPVPLAMAGAVASGMLLGLHAAHETTDEHGRPLDIVHRDVSPQNVLVGADGMIRLVDFGIAKAAGRLQSTTEGAVKGKAGYMAPEQLEGTVDRRCDLYATSVVLWEMLTGQRLFAGESQAQVLTKVLAGHIPSIRSLAPDVPEALEQVVLQGLERSPDRRFSTAREMERALRRVSPIATAFDVAEWLEGILGASLRDRATQLSRIEASPFGGPDSSVPVVGPTVPANAGESEAATEAPTTRPVWPLRTWRSASVLALAVALGAAASATFLLGARRAVSSPSGTAPVSAPTPQLAPEPPDAPSSAAPPDSAAPQSARAPEAASAPPADSSPKRRQVLRAVPGGSRTPRPSCQPPYIVTAEGQKHFRPECM